MRLHGTNTGRKFTIICKPAAAVPRAKAVDGWRGWQKRSTSRGWCLGGSIIFFKPGQQFHFLLRHWLWDLSLDGCIGRWYKEIKSNHVNYALTFVSQWSRKNLTITQFRARTLAPILKLTHRQRTHHPRTTKGDANFRLGSIRMCTHRSCHHQQQPYHSSSASHLTMQILIVLRGIA